MYACLHERKLPRRKINGDVVIKHLNTRQLVVGVVACRARVESLVERHNWFSNQFVEIPRRSIIVCFSSLSAKAGLNLPAVDQLFMTPEFVDRVISCS
jgi:hypothetical protein